MRNKLDMELFWNGSYGEFGRSADILPLTEKDFVRNFIRRINSIKVDYRC